MSFSSRSSRNNQYRNGNNGSNNYQKKGFLGNLMNMIGSGGMSIGQNNRNQNQNRNQPMINLQQGNTGNMICGKCNSQIPRGSKFCLECGEKANDVLHCTNCGEKLPPNAKFCVQCGTKQIG